MQINKPLSMQEYKEFRLYPEGDYNFEVIEAVEKISSNGNEMINLKLYISNEIRSGNIYDNLMEMMGEKLFSFVYCVGLEDAYHNNRLNSNICVNRRGTLKLIIKKDKNGEPKNEVRKYYFNESKVDANANTNTNPNTGSVEFVDSDLPF